MKVEINGNDYKIYNEEIKIVDGNETTVMTIIDSGNLIDLEQTKTFLENELSNITGRINEVRSYM